ncbi:MAG: HupE/UreJ family protein [Hyphomicrobiales bacterium]|nr:HupE/UreJ family protein [Hyphomicrobiales bacterium]
MVRSHARSSGAIASRWVGLVLALLLLTGLSVPAAAHFLLNLNVRILHVEHLADGLKVYLRTPMPYLVAARVGPMRADGLPEPAPYTTNQKEEGKLVHYVDFDQLKRDPKGLGAFAADGFRLVANGKPLLATLEQVHLYRVGMQPDFATLDEAKAAFAAGQAYPDKAKPLYVGDAVVDIMLRYRAGGPVYAYTLGSTLDPGLPGQEKTANLILDYAPGGTKVFRARGLLAEPVAISRSALSAVLTFIKEGIRHILEGLDHVLFVLCLVLGAGAFRSLVWRVTGFTIGHSVTLSAGFFGFVPSGAWFVPAVETGISLSIIYAAAIAVLPRFKQADRERNLFLVTCAIGLLHGLGFSFVLHKILQITSPDIWQSLLAFNMGVEIGQLTIIVVAWPLFRLIERFSGRAWRLGRWGVAVTCAAVALVWTGQRVLSVIGAL